MERSNRGWVELRPKVTMFLPDNSPILAWIGLEGNGCISRSLSCLFELSVWYNELMPKRLIPVSCLIAAVILLVMLNFTTPASVGPLGVLVFFTTFYVLVFGLAVGAVKVFTKLAGGQMGKKGYLYGAVIAFGPILLMLAQSLGSISWPTIALTGVFVLLGCFLVSKRL